MTPEKPEPAFPSERALKEHFARNLHLIEPGLILVDTEFPCIPYPERTINPKTGQCDNKNLRVRPSALDILAIDPSNRLVAIELKLLNGDPASVGQLAGYMRCIKDHVAAEGQTVRGIIVAKRVTWMAWYALRCIGPFEVALREYDESGATKPLDLPLLPATQFTLEF